MSLCKKCEGNEILTNFPFHPPKKVLDESDPKKQTEMFNKLNEYCIENMSYPCPECKPLEYKVYELEMKCNKLERWFRRYIDKGRAGDCETCLGITAQEIIDEEIPMVKHIIEDEMWLEAERRQCPVCDNDLEVQKHIADVIKEKGEEMRDNAVDIIRKKKKKGGKNDT